MDSCLLTLSHRLPTVEERATLEPIDITAPHAWQPNTFVHAHDPTFHYLLNPMLFRNSGKQRWPSLPSPPYPDSPVQGETIPPLQGGY